MKVDLSSIDEVSGELTRILSWYRARIDDWQPAMLEAAQAWWLHERDWLTSEGNGTWPALQPETVAEKERLGVTEPAWPMVRTGALFRSLTGPNGPYSVYETDRDTLTLGIDWAPAQAHQEGAGRLPARPVFILTDQLIADIRDVLRDHLRATRRNRAGGTP